MADESITVKNTSPGKKYLASGDDSDDTLVKPGEEKTLTGTDVEEAETYIERGIFEIVEGDVDVEPDSETSGGGDPEVKKGIDSESIVKDLPYLNDAQREDLIEKYENLHELQEGLSQEELEEMEDIGEAYAEDILEAVQEQ